MKHGHLQSSKNVKLKMEGPDDPEMDSDSESETMSPGPSLSAASLHGKKNINRGRWNKEEVIFRRTHI